MVTEETYLDPIMGPQLVLQSTIRVPGLRVKRNALNGGLYMATEITGQVGPALYQDNTQGMALRQGRTGELMVSEVHGHFYEQASRGRLFYSHCNAQTTSAVATGMTGNIIWNPPNSTSNLSLIAVASSILVTAATAVGVVLAQSVQTAVPGSTTAATRSGRTIIGYAGALDQGGFAICYSIATLTTAPTAFYHVEHNTAAINTVGQGDDPWRLLDGMFVIPPGNAVCIATVGAAAGTAGHTSTIVYEEIPI